MSHPPHLLHVFPTFVAAGAQVRTVRLMRGLAGRYRHSVVSLSGRTDALALLGPGVDVRSLEVPRRAGLLAGARAMRELLAVHRPQLLCTYNWGSFDAVLAARVSGQPHVHHEDGFNADEAARQKRRRVLARRLGLARARAVVVPSHRLEAIAREVWRLPADRVHLVPNGIRVEDFAPGVDDRQSVEDGGLDARASLGIPPDALVVGSVGHLRPVKRYDRLIEACARVDPSALGGRPLHLVLVGDGELRADLEARARSGDATRLAVHFAGHRDALAPWYHAFDVFCLSSDSEQQPVSLLEAMAAGVPAVATDVGDIRDNLPEEAGALLCPLAGEATTDALARALARLLADEPLRRRLAALGTARVRERYSFEAMRDAYDAIYARAMGSRAPRGLGT